MATGVTPRLGSVASGGQSYRLTQGPQWTLATDRIEHLLMLEGDEDGDIFLEGDMQAAALLELRLEGDAAIVGGSATNRVGALT